MRRPASPTLPSSALKKLGKLKKRQLKKRPKKKQQIKLSKRLRGQLLERKKYRIRLQLQPHPKQTQEVLKFPKVKDHDPLAHLVVIYANSSRNCMNSS